MKTFSNAGENHNRSFDLELLESIPSNSKAKFKHWGRTVPYYLHLQPL